MQLYILQVISYSRMKKTPLYLLQSLEAECSTWLFVEVEYELETEIMQIFPEKHNHQQMLLYHNIVGPQTYK